ncbi:MAG: hypothetical protein J6Q02_01320, partial [Lachnospiraceae bacterium]|nr:hypothetical protein [Lachnospiraceae bacterium]
GASTVKAFVASALEWRRRIDNMDGDDVEDDDEAADQPSEPAFDGWTVCRFPRAGLLSLRGV